MHALKFFGLKSKKQAGNHRVLVDFKINKQDCLYVFYSYHETNFLVFIELSI
jgi:hypothetical protein